MKSSRLPTPTLSETAHDLPGATHLFEEPGTLEDVSEQALKWFQRHFASA